jgi:hypothetical protein
MKIQSKPSKLKFGSNFLDTTPKAKGNKRKNRKNGLHKIKTFMYQDSLTRARWG